MGRPVLLEGPRLAFAGLRVPGWSYVDHGTSEELYDLAADPHQLQNVAGDAAHAERKAQLAAELARMRNCAGVECYRGPNDPVLPPGTRIESGPGEGSVTTDDDPAFTYSGLPAEGVTGFECDLDGAGFVPCAAEGAAYADVPDGERTFSVRALNAGGADPTPATRTWTVDTTPPALTIDSGPEGETPEPRPSFGFTAEAGAAAECSLEPGDGESFGPCSGDASHSPSEPLADGDYTFRVRARDAAGNEASAARAFTVAVPPPPPDPPDTSIDSGPADGSIVADDDPAFTYSGAPAADVTGFECDLDGAGYAPCPAEGIGYPDVPNGSRTFSVRAIGPGGADSTPATRAWTVDTVAPALSITGGPEGATIEKQPAFTFTTEAGASVECAIDAGIGGLEPVGGYGPCSDPGSHAPAAPLADGSYVFHVRATDAAGNTAAATRAFSVVTPPPPPADPCAGAAHPITGGGRITGTPGDDVIVGSAGADRIDGNGGNDLVCAGAGDDVITMRAGNDAVHGGDGRDSVTGAGGNDALAGGAGDDTLVGSAGNDTLLGEAGNDNLQGGDGADVLRGGEGDDALDGGNGSDQGEGGPGTDTFVRVEALLDAPP